MPKADRADTVKVPGQRAVLDLGNAKLLHTLPSAPDAPSGSSLAWSPSGNLLATYGRGGTLDLWDWAAGIRTFSIRASAPILCSAFDPHAQRLACGDEEGGIWMWDTASGAVTSRQRRPSQTLSSLAFHPTDDVLAGAGGHSVCVRGASDGELIWESALSGRVYLRPALGEGEPPNYRVTYSPDGHILAVRDHLRVWLYDAHSGNLLKRVEARDDAFIADFAFNPVDGLLAVSRGPEASVEIVNPRNGKTVRVLESPAAAHISFGRHSGLLILDAIMASAFMLWRADTYDAVAVMEYRFTAPGEPIMCTVALHPSKPILAVRTSRVLSSRTTRSATSVFEMDAAFLLRASAPTNHYVNAKVVLVGDTGVGKTGLSLALNYRAFEASASTPGRQVWPFDSREVAVGTSIETRETLLWDLGGQPGYRIIHQLHLSEVAVALVVFDARSEIDPLAGVRYWCRALRVAQQRRGALGVPIKEFLVSARNDRGGVSLSRERLDTLLAELGFAGYFETSAKEGWQIQELRSAIEEAIPWEDLPKVSSPRLFADIKAFLLEMKKTGQALAPASLLLDEFSRQRPDMAASPPSLLDQFAACIGRLENCDLIRHLSFGDLVLLQPELLDAYASSMINAAKREPDGLGSLTEEAALTGTFFVPSENRVRAPGQEQLLLHATVEELVRHDLAFRESTDGGRYLVFPSQFNRDYADSPEPKGKAAVIVFDGPVQNLYSTLAVRLAHSELFTTGRSEMWRNASVYTAKMGGRCGLLLHEFDEARGRLTLFSDEYTSPETRFHFEEFVLEHIRRHACGGTVWLSRALVCAGCGETVPDAYVRMLQSRGLATFDCPCGASVPLTEAGASSAYRSEVTAMDEAADQRRDFEAFLVSARGETSTKSFQEWSGGERVTLAIAFTDVVNMTALNEDLRDEAADTVRRAHFAQSRELIGKFNGKAIKTIGDSFMAAFRCADDALDYALALRGETGHPLVHVRAGIHVGPMHVEEEDVFGGTVNFAARVVGAIEDAEIWLSDRAKDDVDRLGAARHSHLKWHKHEHVPMKGFHGDFTLWSVE